MLIRYRPNRRGIRQLLGRDSVRAILEAKAQGIAEHARAAYEADPPHQGQVEVTVDSEAGETGGHYRARAAVVAKHPGVLHIEADRRSLGAAVDAAKF